MHQAEPPLSVLQLSRSGMEREAVMLRSHDGHAGEEGVGRPLTGYYSKTPIRSFEIAPSGVSTTMKNDCAVTSCLARKARAVSLSGAL